MDHKQQQQQHATFGTLKERQWSTIYNQSAPVVLREASTSQLGWLVVPTYAHKYIYIYIYLYNIIVIIVVMKHPMTMTDSER